MKSHTQFISVRPLAKERPRATKGGHVYTPKRTSEYEKKVAEAYTGECFDKSHTVSVSLVISIDGTHITVTATEAPEWKTSLKGDVDNYVKSILDALNGVAWADDKQVLELKVTKK